MANLRGLLYALLAGSTRPIFLDLLVGVCSVILVAWAVTRWKGRYEAGGAVGRFDATFEQHSEGATPALTGEIKFNYSTAKSGVLISEPWSAWSPNITSPRMVAVGGVAVQVQTRMPGITYNSAKLSGAAAPRTLADLLRPEYKGRVATTLSTALFERLAGSEVWGPERTLALGVGLGF